MTDTPGNAQKRKIQVRGNFHKPLLFLLDPETMVIEIKHHSTTYIIPLFELITFTKTLKPREIYYAKIVLETSEDDLTRGQFE